MKAQKRSPRLPRVHYDTFRSILNGGRGIWLIKTEHGTATMVESDDGWCLIESLEINETSQNKGHGTLFLRALEKAASRAKALGLFLQVGDYIAGKRPERKLSSWYANRGYKTVRGSAGWLRMKALKTPTKSPRPKRKSSSV